MNKPERKSLSPEELRAYKEFRFIRNYAWISLVLGVAMVVELLTLFLK